MTKIQIEAEIKTQEQKLWRLLELGLWDCRKAKILEAGINILKGQLWDLEKLEKGS